jgi:molecular chaperone HscA
LLATGKGLHADADLLDPSERSAVESALLALKNAIASATSPSAVQSAIDALDHATHDWAGRRMNRAVAQAIAGKSVGDIEKSVEHAAGVDAHVARHRGDAS